MRGIPFGTAAVTVIDNTATSNLTKALELVVEGVVIHSPAQATNEEVLGRVGRDILTLLIHLGLLGGALVVVSRLSLLRSFHLGGSIVFLILGGVRVRLGVILGLIGVIILGLSALALSLGTLDRLHQPWSGH